MRFAIGFVCGVAVARPVLTLVDKYVPPIVHEKVIDGLNAINVRLVALGDNLHRKMEEKRNDESR
ncbi:hypothetical protein SEA_CRICKO_54 [Streptomyces phage CricKo]|jgi:hypothetical protein|nr:hypothetical protein SEA_RAINYDAI_52 [Streptomyces phage Rainydai]AWN06153.1 hypothetical protein SEA_SENDITCS_50 [Streptomyces phage SendItCS]QJD49937.1 hypothetical protein SEA_CRICKO_54 [Streptomyces phage CricKo]QNL30669.1 hypothetical protein SEA_THIQQUMS_54 [Streptomyces phage Thiqqums]WIC89388.1 hypothetical protein SEA_MIEK_51 [Streptomyces phage Miek]